MSKGVDTRGGEVKSVFEGHSDQSLGFVRTGGRGRKSQKTGRHPPSPPTTTTKIQTHRGHAEAGTGTETHTHRVYIQRPTCRNIWKCPRGLDRAKVS